MGQIQHRPHRNRLTLRARRTSRPQPGLPVFGVPYLLVDERFSALGFVSSPLPSVALVTDTPLLTHPALEAAGVLERGLTELAAASLWSLSDRETLALRERLEAVRSGLDARVLAATREVDARAAAAASGAATTAAWLTGRLHLHPAAAKTEITLAADLDGSLPRTAAALAAGQITREQAAAIASGIRALPRRLEPSLRDEAETFLVEQAAQFDPAALRKLARHLTVTLDPEHADQLEREEVEAADRQELTLSTDAYGAGHLRGSFDPEGRALLQAALDAVSGPRRGPDGERDPRSPSQRRAEGLLDLIRLALAHDDMPEAGGEPVTVLLTAPFHVLHGHDESSACRPDCPPRPTTPGRPPADQEPQRASTDGSALFGTADPGDAGSLPAGDPGDSREPGDGGGREDAQREAQVDAAGVSAGALAVPPASDASGRPAGAPASDASGAPAGSPTAHLEDGTPVSPETARRMSCDAWLVAAIIATTGEILDIGRLSRTVPRPIRRALIARDGGCAFPGCGRPPRWCHAHHIWHWSKGGPTALHNLVLLCGAHHRVIHHHGWEVWLDPDTGLPLFRAPRWIDPDQRPRPPWRPPVLWGHPLRT